MATVFVSYSRADQDKVENIVQDIKDLDHEVWFDHELSGGQNWWEKILSNIREADIFIFILSPESRESTACKREYTYAHNLGKPVIPLQVADGVSINLLPVELSTIQIVDYLKPDRKSAFRLARALGSIKEFKSLPDPLPEAPDVPISYLGSISAKIDSVEDLSFQEQSTLLVEIKSYIRDKEYEEDGAILLKRFRKRRDVYARIAVDLDEILRGFEESKVSPPPEPVALFDPPDTESEQTNNVPADEQSEVEIPVTKEPTRKQRKGAALIYMVIGFLVWNFVFFIWFNGYRFSGSGHINDWGYYYIQNLGMVFVVAMSWFAAGGIAAKRILPFILVVFSVFAIFLFIGEVWSWRDENALEQFSVFSFGGVILASFIGVIISNIVKKIRTKSVTD